MKKLCSIICFVLYIHSFSQEPKVGDTAQKSSGEKVLIKALAVFANPEWNKKAATRTLSLSGNEVPLHESYARIAQI